MLKCHTQHNRILQNLMKTKCKHIDITDEAFIRKAISDWKAHKTVKAFYERKDIQALRHECNDDEQQLIQIVQSEIQQRHLKIDPIQFDLKVDNSNGKTRVIAIESAKQQIYDYIAYNALEDLAPYIGYYQIACKPGQGPIFGAKVVHSWLKEKERRVKPDGSVSYVYTCRYAVKADLRHAYASISHDNMMHWLEKRVSNEDLLWLISTLLQSIEHGYPSKTFLRAISRDSSLQDKVEESRHGLPIGSVLSIRLCALYVADVYHMNEAFTYTRRGCTSNPIGHQMFNIDDIYLFGLNARQLIKAIRADASAFQAKGMELHEDWKLIDLNPKRKDAHIDVLGYKVYRDHITMRRRDYLKTKRALSAFKKHPNADTARKLVSYSGLFIKHTNSTRFCRKYDFYKGLRKARKVISDDDKSNLLK